MDTKGIMNPDGTITMTHDVKKGEHFRVYAGVPVDHTQERLTNMRAALEIAHDYIKEDPCECNDRYAIMCARCRTIKIMKQTLIGVYKL